MLFTAIFTLFGLMAWVAAGVLLHFRRKTLRKTEAMRKVETSRVKDVSGMAPGTPVEVKGTLRCEEPLTSEMAGQDCAYYLSQVMRVYQDTHRDSDGDLKTRRRSEVVSSTERFAPFSVEDGYDAVPVHAEGAEVDALKVVDRFEKYDGGGGLELGGFKLHLRGAGERTLGYRYVESVLPIDAPVYVLGFVSPDGGLGHPPAGDGTGNFIISYRSEEQLAKKYGNDALWQTLIALGLFVFGALFVAVGVASAVGIL